MELELTFALLPQDLQQLSRQLARLPLTGRRKPRRQTLHKTYCDTPEHSRQDPRVALPLLTARFERLSWTITLEDATVELALDHGSVLCDGRSTPLCELEIKLQRGAPDALFQVAALLSQHLSLLPLHMGKAERAYRLAEGTLHAPRRAKPPGLAPDMAFCDLTQAVLRECFLQFSANLYTLRSSDAPEVLHQARVGWRRFRGAARLFKQHASPSDLGTLAVLQPLQRQMALLRDLDVMASEVLPTYAAAYQAGTPERALQWRQLEDALELDRQAQRAQLLQQLAEPAVGQALLHITRWLEWGTPALPPTLAKPDAAAPAKWLRKRLQKLAAEMAALQLQARSAQDLHRLRILAKRLRYGVENLRPLLRSKRAERWLRSAAQLQTHIGRERDQQQAIAHAERLQAASEIIGFLRGAAFAAAQAPAPPA